GVAARERGEGGGNDAKALCIRDDRRISGDRHRSGEPAAHSGRFDQGSLRSHRAFRAAAMCPGVLFAVPLDAADGARLLSTGLQCNPAASTAAPCGLSRAAKPARRGAEATKAWEEAT